MSQEDFDKLEESEFKFDKDGKLIILSKFLVNGRYN